MEKRADDVKEATVNEAAQPMNEPVDAELALARENLKRFTKRLDHSIADF